MPKTRTTVTLDEEILRMVKVHSARTGRGDSQVIEDAIRSAFGVDVVKASWEPSKVLTDEEIAERARNEVRSARMTKRWAHDLTEEPFTWTVWPAEFDPTPDPTSIARWLNLFGEPGMFLARFADISTGAIEVAYQAPK